MENYAERTPHWEQATLVPVMLPFSIIKLLPTSPHKQVNEKLIPRSHLKHFTIYGRSYLTVGLLVAILYWPF